jgi:methionyl-tRNA synthetase
MSSYDKTMARYGIAPRAVTRDLSGESMSNKEKMDWKCIYVWFEAVQGYLTCSQIGLENMLKIPLHGSHGGATVKI